MIRGSSSPLVSNLRRRCCPPGRDIPDSALTLTLVAVIPATIAVVLAGVALEPVVGIGILVFAPWLGVTLVQDVGRSILFATTRALASPGATQRGSRRWA